MLSAALLPGHIQTAHARRGLWALVGVGQRLDTLLRPRRPMEPRGFTGMRELCSMPTHAPGEGVPNQGSAQSGR